MVLITAFFITVFLSALQLANATKSITVQNNCGSVVTVGVLTNGVSSGSAEQSFDLTTGASQTISKGDTWGGRIWGRYQCSGAAGKDVANCGVPGATNPATLAEFFFKGANGRDFYDISLVDGYNIHMAITPHEDGGASNGYTCGAPKCAMSSCPPEYAVTDSTGNVISCQSSCSKTGSPQDCCSGSYNTPETCKPSSDSLEVKSECPDAYSFAYDDQKSTFECAASSYTVTFC